MSQEKYFNLELLIQMMGSELREMQRNFGDDISSELTRYIEQILTWINEVHLYIGLIYGYEERDVGIMYMVPPVGYEDARNADELKGMFNTEESELERRFREGNISSDEYRRMQNEMNRKTIEYK